MSSYTLVHLETISGEGEITSPVESIGVALSTFPPGQGSTGNSPPRLAGLGQIGLIFGTERGIGQAVVWEQFRFIATGGAATGVWYQLSPGVTADLAIYVLVDDSLLDESTLGNSGPSQARITDLILT